MVRLLRVLARSPTPLTGRSLAMAAEVAWARASEALQRLVAFGVVRRQPAGRANLYSLDTEHYVVSDVLLPAPRAESRWLEKLGEEVLMAAGDAAESVVLYGSFARGEATESSDVDLLVVSPGQDRAREAQEQLDASRGRLERRFGRSISFRLLSREDLRQRLVRGDPFIREIAEHGHALAGGYTDDADINAARNILSRFLSGAYGPGSKTTSVVMG